MTPKVDMINMLAGSLSKEMLVVHLDQAIQVYRLMPIDENWARVASCAALVAMKESADMARIEHLLFKMAENTIPFWSTSAN